jgi:hypothetical protein
MQVPLSEVPIEVRRLAAQHLASVHGTEMASDADAAFLDENVVPVYRPDVDGVAYYEFTVVARRSGGRILLSRAYAKDAGGCSPTTDGGGKNDTGSNSPIGFVVVTNGRHDFPISHWSLNRQPPSRQVATDPHSGCSDKAPRSGLAARLYRLDSLAYAAEDEGGQLVGQTGQLPAAISGLPHSLGKAAGQIESSIARMDRVPPNDDGTQDARHTLERSGREPPGLKRDDEGGWPALKKRYADAFGPLLDHLRERASKTWELHDLMQKMGEGIEAGATHRVALLGDAAIELAGEGSRYVQPELDESGDGPPALVLRTKRARLQTELDLDVHVSYRNGERERLKFFIYSREVPSNEKARQTDDCGPNCEE